MPPSGPGNGVCTSFLMEACPWRCLHLEGAAAGTPAFLQLSGSPEWRPLKGCAGAPSSGAFQHGTASWPRIHSSYGWGGSARIVRSRTSFARRPIWPAARHGLRRRAPGISMAAGLGAVRASAGCLGLPIVLPEPARRVVVKARFVKLAGKGAKGALAHLRYLQRDGTTREGQRGMLYAADHDVADGKAFLERCAGDRHQFRFIVAPEDGAQ